MNDFIFAYHIDKIANFRQLGNYQQLKAYVEQLDESTKSALESWYSHVLQKPMTKSDTLPLASRHNIDGWCAFYQHQYATALDSFKQCITTPDWQKTAPDGALGIAKVYTRTGHWALAKAWCLYYLSLVRQSYNHFEIVKGYGALAEIFLRANQPQQALGCFQIAYHLTPLQSEQKSRQYNFMASALLRHGEFLRAKALLHNSYQDNIRLYLSAPDNDEYRLGQLHALMRLQFLSLQENKTLIPFDSEILDKPTKTLTLTTMPSGMIWIAQGIAKLYKQDIDGAMVNFHQAMLIFKDKLLFEYLWACRLYEYCQAQKQIAYQVDTDVIGQAQALFAIYELKVPVHNAILDKTWQHVAVHNQGFHSLLHQDLSLDELIGLWQQFFI